MFLTLLSTYNGPEMLGHGGALSPGAGRGAVDEPDG